MKKITITIIVVLAMVMVVSTAAFCQQASGSGSFTQKKT